MGGVQGQQVSRGAALTELRTRLADGLAKARLNKTQLATRAGLGRTTVQSAFQDGGPVPSAESVVALARTLKLSENELLDLRRTATGEDAVAPQNDLGPGKLITEWNPYALEVHPAGPAVQGTTLAHGLVLPGYVRRNHDQLDQRRE